MRPLALAREQILAYRRSAQDLDERLPPVSRSLRLATWAGLQDSVPRSALHSIHARVEHTAPDAWADPQLVQVWGPRYAAYVVAAGDHAAFTLGRLPERGRTHQRAVDLAARLQRYLDGRRLPYGDAGQGIGVHGNSLRYAALTGTVLIRWEGARQPTVWTVPPPEMDPVEARLDLARRFLHVFGPSTVGSFIRWAGVDRSVAIQAFDALGPSLIEVRTPLGAASMLAADEPNFRAPALPPSLVRLLPSGDPYFLLWGPDRELLVSNAAHRALLWTSRVWPGAVLVGGEIAGTWRRAETLVTVTPWRHFSADERHAVEAEAATLPLPDARDAGAVRWDDSIA